jgi:high-affinity iron transporter
MTFGLRLGRAAAALALVIAPGLLRAQDRPVQRIATIVSVAVEEYGKAVDANGRLISNDEYQETIGFLADARSVAARLPGSLSAPRLLLDSIAAAVESKKPPAVLTALGQRFAASLGSEANLELPKKALDIAEGKQIYEKNCVSCHGALGLGDGPAGAALNPKPAAIGSGEAMHDVTPAMMFRKISVGVTGTAMPAYSSLSAEQRWNVVMYLRSLHHSPAQVAQGEGFYTQGCVSCHGTTGLGDGSVARSLSKLPPELGSLAWQVERTDAQLAQAIAAGVPGSPMPPATQLTAAQLQSVVAYVRSLPTHERTIAATSTVADTNKFSAAATQSLALLDRALTAAHDGRYTEAGDMAFDAYAAFEPIETPARARDPGVVASAERLFTEFKASIRSQDINSASRARDAIEASMPRILDLTHPAGTGFEAFLQSFLIILREGFEAILVIGAVVAFLLKTGHRERLRSIWLGIGLALVMSGVTAVVLATVLRAIPASREIIEGVTLLVAVAVLFSVSYWLISRVEAAKWQQFIREKVNSALEHGGGRTLTFVAFLAVYREGAETALFYQALFNEGSQVVLPITLGIVAGFVALAIIFTLFYRFGVRIPMRPFFTVTSALLYYMALVFAGKGIRELQEGNVVPITVIRGMPTIDALGFYPTWQTFLAQLVLLALFAFAVAKTFWPKRSVTLPTVAPQANGSAAIAAEVQTLRTDNEELRRRLAAIETKLGDAVHTPPDGR